jgi:L-threonylcarbamoyladenylate synthase
VLTRRLTDVEEAARILLRGGLVAFPTETVYGLGADGTNPAAVRAIFAAKGRPRDNPLILHVLDREAAEAVAEWDERASDLAARFWPGPLTLVLRARPGVPEEVRAGLPTVAVRSPAHPVARALLAACGRPVAAPSANRSGRPSPTTADAVLDELDGRIDAVLDGGPCRFGVESTVVDASDGPLRLLRPGALPAEVLGLDPMPDPRAPARSPGMRHRHYAPRVPVRLVEDVVGALAEAPEAAVLCTEATARRLPPLPAERLHVLAADPEARARELFAALRRLERSGAPCIVAEALAPQGLDAAVMDRLRRAAGSGT